MLMKLRKIVISFLYPIKNKMGKIISSRPLDYSYTKLPLHLSLYESILNNQLEMSYRGEMTIICEHHPPEVTVEAVRL